MSDLAERLRALAAEHKYPLVGWEQRLVATLHEAANRIEELEAPEKAKEAVEAAMSRQGW